ncbi:MAG TPA: histidine phosphatase family protein [Crenalkalicoccus sp.]|nr:histidine phosphatase family protein [Crenalkalicoccus sp.]
MAATLLLIRHAAHARVAEVLCGRMDGVHLDAAGRAQAAALGARLAGEALAAVCTSPLPRAVETAEAIARPHGLVPERMEDLTEIAFGDWTGRPFAALRDDPDWQRWNAMRASARPPGGEAMAEVRDRVLRGLQVLAARHPEARMAVVSHADVIKAAVAGILGLSLDAHDRFEIAPASVSTVVLWPGGGKVLGLNAAEAA